LLNENGLDESFVVDWFADSNDEKNPPFWGVFEVSVEVFVAVVCENENKLLDGDWVDENNELVVETGCWVENKFVGWVEENKDNGDGLVGSCDEIGGTFGLDANVVVVVKEKLDVVAGDVVVIGGVFCVLLVLPKLNFNCGDSVSSFLFSIKVVGLLKNEAVVSTNGLFTDAAVVVSTNGLFDDAVVVVVAPNLNDVEGEEVPKKSNFGAVVKGATTIGGVGVGAVVVAVKGMGENLNAVVLLNDGNLIEFVVDTSSTCFKVVLVTIGAGVSIVIGAVVVDGLVPFNNNNEFVFLWIPFSVLVNNVFGKNSFSSWIR